jgi:predicted nucleotidyltransferase component of viral defense system
MSLDVVENRLKEYQPKTKQEEINALKEICQEIALSGLARSEFFKKGAFQGGTCLRILYGLKRFSEDLDFVLLKTENDFSWGQYLKSIELEFNSFGLSLEVLDRSQVQNSVKRAFLKENSFAKILELKHGFLPSDKQTVKIKLEIDVNPPQGSSYEIHYLDYPYPFSILCQDLPSLFASKCHSLLCRKYNKGRDWFDFLFYVSKKVPINYHLLANALFQAGPFKEKREAVNKDWVKQHLQLKINEIDWKTIRLDVEAFLKPEDRKYVENWNRELFSSILQNLA